MLSFLQIENIAIIDALSVEFSAGLNILTGETGAGKSVLIDSINAVSGAKTSRELIRTGEESAFVAAVFTGIDERTSKLLADMGFGPDEDGSVQLRRTMFRDGRNTCFINGTACTVAMLKNAAMSLINIHGQRDSQELLRSESHLGFVDLFAKDEKELNDYRSEYEKLVSVKKEIEKLTMDEGYKARRTDLLAFQIKELESAGIVPGETEKLKKRRGVIRNAVKVTSALNGALAALAGAEDSAGAQALISDAQKSIESVTDVVHELKAVSESLGDVRETVLDAVSVLDDALSQLDGSENDIDAVEERLDLLYRLSKKYGGSEEEMLDFLAGAKEELENISSSEEKLAELNAEYLRLLESAEKKAELLSAKRGAAGRELSAAVESELKELNMPNVRFITRITDIPLSETGADDVEFVISANPGEEPKPLGKVASGGELSRVMLAIKTVLNSSPDITLIFDEIDTGISGTTAGKIAAKLKRLSENNQILCITHSSQIASYADSHMFLYKTVESGKTYTRVKYLKGDERACELARMTFGDGFSDVQLESARGLLRKARECAG